MAYLGSIGLGLVWGWLIGFLDSPILRPGLVVVASTISTVILTGEVYWFAGLRTTPTFLIAVGLGLFLHSRWRREFRRRCQTVSQHL
jgi:hypothetical protein